MRATVLLAGALLCTAFGLIVAAESDKALAVILLSFGLALTGAGLYALKWED